MRVVVLGANGQIGRALMKCVPDSIQALPLTRSELDLRDLTAIARTIDDLQPDWLINCAAYTDVDGAEANSELAMSINADAPREMARALTKTSGRLLQLSSDFVFDGAKGRPYLPEDACNPLSVYGQSKLAGERNAGDDALIVRTSWVYDAGGENFVRTMLELMRSRDEVKVVSDQVGSPSWAPGIARVLWSLLAKHARGVYHHCDDGAISWFEFAQAIAEEARALGLLSKTPQITPISSADFGAEAARPSYSVLDCSATRAVLDDTPTGWLDNLRQMLAHANALGSKCG